MTHASKECPETGFNRRRHNRYPLELELQFTAGGRDSSLSGSGRSINISSGGLLFRSTRRLREGDPLVLAADWPVQFDSAKRLVLLVSGHVVWRRGTKTAVAIAQYELVPDQKTAAISVQSDDHPMIAKQSA